MKNRANRKSIFLKYKIYKAIISGIPISKLSKMFKVSTKTILDIKKNGFYKKDEILEIINMIREKFPHFTLKEIKNYLKIYYNVDLSITSIHYKINKEIDENLYQFLEIVVNEGNSHIASEILKNFLSIDWPYNRILEKIDDKFLNYSLLADKYYYLLYSGKLRPNDELLKVIEKYMEICKEKELKYSYYKWFNLKIRILQALLRYDEIIKIFNYKEIIKLPFPLKSYILAVVAQVSLILNDKNNISVINFFKRRFKSKRNRFGKLSNDYKQFLFNYYLSSGKPKIASSYIHNSIINLLTGNYRKFLKLNLKLTIEQKIPQEILKSWCYLFSKDFFRFLKIVNKVKNELESFPVYTNEFLLTLALKEAIMGNYESMRNLLKRTNNKILKAISEGKPNILGRYRKFELLAKYLLKGNIKQAVKIAKNYGIITHLRIYTLLTKKSPKTIGKYKELRVVSYILRNRPRLIKFYFLRKKPIIKFDKKVITASGRSNDLFSVLYYLALEKNISKHCNIYELERQGFRNVVNKVYNINRKIGYKVLSIKGNEIYLNAEIWTDIDAYLKSKDEKLLKCYPFDKLSFKYRWADFYRDLLL
ncbi:MAG: hypothetical protein ABIL52_03950 [candidate division WOR-3 bacterium]